jgi:tight adherence protein B
VIAVWATRVLGYSGILLVVVGLAAVARGMAAGDSFAVRFHRQYTAGLDRSLRLLFMKGSGRRVAAIQLGAMAALCAAGLVLELTFAYGLAALAAVGPVAYLARERARHVKQVESQVDQLVTALANCLKTVPSPAAALSHVVSVLPRPTRLEIDRVLSEMRVGSTLEQALLNMSSRLRSPELDAALSAMLIGLQVGGNLPRVLEGTAETIREMHRLEGVVRTKTSDGRAQLWVLALFPFVICFAFSLLDPEYFTPLRNTVVGTLVAIVAIGFWIAGLALARKIVKVDI